MVLGRRGVVVLAEDDDETVMLIKEILEAEDFRVARASDGRAVMPLVEEESPNVVILDIMMPGVDGLTAAMALKARFKKLPIVIVSCSDSEAHHAYASAVGVKTYLTKPFRSKDLLAAIRSAMEDSQIE